MTPRCPRCFGRTGDCLCDRLVPLETRARFVVLQHQLELSKVSNTGRIVALALAGAELRVYGFEARLGDLAEEGTWLLYPGDEATPPPSPPPRRIVVLDASWSQARRMAQRVPALRGLPRLSLKPAQVTPSLRTAPPGGMSTLQAVARCLELLGEAPAAAHLDALHEAMVARVVRARGYL